MSSVLKLLVFTTSESEYDHILTTLREGHVISEARGVFRSDDFRPALETFHPTVVVAECDDQELVHTLLRQTHATDADLPFIVLAGVNDAARAVDLMKAGADDYMVKSGLRRLPSTVTYHSDQYAYRLMERKVLLQSRHADETLRLIHEHMEDFVFLLDDRGHLAYSSPSFQTLLPNRVLDRNYDVFKDVHPGDRGHVMEAFRSLLQQPESRRIEFRFQTEPDEVRHLESHWNVIEGDHGQTRYVMVVARIVTKRKKAEEALRENVKHFRALLENISDAISLINPYGIVLFTSRSTHRVLGYHAQQFVGLNIFDLVHPDDRQGIIREINDLRDQPAKLTAMRFRCKHRDGTWRWMDGVANNLLHDPVVKAIVFNYRDVTQKKGAEDALRRSEERFRAMIENSYDSIWLLAADGSISYVAPSSEVITGHHPEDTIHQPLWHFVHPDDLEKVRDKFKKLTQRADQVEMFDFRMLHRDGEYRWVEGVANNLLLQPMLEAVVFNFRDVTERTVAANAVTAERERLRVTLSSIADGVVATDTFGNVILLNESAERILEISHADAVGKPIAALLNLSNVEAGVTEPVSEVLKTKRATAYAQWSLEHKEGKRTLSAQASPIHDQKGDLQGVVLIIRDMTEQLRTENELQKAKKIESIGILAGGIAHDFNNILSAVLGNISIAKLKIEHGHREKSIELLGRAEKASERARDLTQQLLTFSKGGAPVRKASSIGDLLKDSASFSAAGSNVRLTFDIPPDLLQVNIDSGQISQVINNLVINARHAMPNGGTITIAAGNVSLQRNQVAALPQGDYVQISITDEGIGIPEENLSKIFDPYFTTKKTGSGLGLATSYSIIRNHQGAITVHSKPGAGTTFHLYIPATGGRVTEIAEAPVSTFNGHGHVLVVDDESAILEMSTAMLESLGFKVTCTRSGTEAIQLYTDQRKQGAAFDLVIMDLTIPGGMSGLETFGKLKEIDPYVRAVVSSGYSNDPVMANFSRHGFLDVLSKPYKLEELVRVLKGMVAER